MSKFITLREISDENYKSQLAHGYPNIPKGAEVEMLDRDFINFYGNWVIIQWNGNHYYTRKEYIKEVEERNIDEHIKEKYLELQLTPEEDNWVLKASLEIDKSYKKKFKVFLDRWIELLQIDGRNTKHQVLMEMKELSEMYDYTERGKIK